MIELERTFLAKHLPAGLKKCKKKEIIDVYIPKSIHHPILRIRKNGMDYEITKKSPIANNASIQEENTIKLSKDEFESLSNVPGKIARKIRHQYRHGGQLYEIDVFQGLLKGLVIIDVEFRTQKEMRAFKMPDFCLVDISNDPQFAGGMLCGKKYSDVKLRLRKLGYKRIRY